MAPASRRDARISPRGQSQISHGPSPNAGFKLCRTETKKEAEQSSKGAKPSVNSVTSVRVFLLSGKQRRAPRKVDAQEPRRRKARTESTEFTEVF
jgi:hypothetical protein